MKTLRELQEIYDSGINITKYLKEIKELENNSDNIIEIAYDFQSGSYIESLSNKEYASYLEKYAEEIVHVICSLCDPISILEAGVGEATTLERVASKIKKIPTIYGFDISLSRILYGKNWLLKNNLDNVHLVTGNLFEIPFLDNSIDVVYTSHSIEPNGGNEEKILKELFRVTRKFLILLEPGYELANKEAQKRMDSHGYCKGIKKTAISLGYNVIEHKLFPYSSNTLNPTALTIIQKEITSISYDDSVFACPRYGTALTRNTDSFFSEESLLAYPIIKGVPCLRKENAVLVSKYNFFN